MSPVRARSLTWALAAHLNLEAHLKAPDVRNTVRDEEHNVTYHIMAYRTLSKEEMILTVRQYLAQPRLRRRKTRERHKVITILTVHGASPNL